MTEIDYLGAESYRMHPDDPILVAEKRTALLLLVRNNLAMTGNKPGIWPSTDDDTVARKILAGLLDLGWTPPTADTIAAAVDALPPLPPTAGG